MYDLFEHFDLCKQCPRDFNNKFQDRCLKRDRQHLPSTNCRLGLDHGENSAGASIARISSLLMRTVRLGAREQVLQVREVR